MAELPLLTVVSAASAVMSVLTAMPDAVRLITCTCVKYMYM